MMAVISRYSNLELLRLPDCGGLLESGRCAWLNVPACTGENCSWRRNTMTQEKARARLRSLDEKTQAHIAKKYYGGTRPWMERKTSCRTAPQPQEEP